MRETLIGNIKGVGVSIFKCLRASSDYMPKQGTHTHTHPKAFRILVWGAPLLGICAVPWGTREKMVDSCHLPLQEHSTR
jgi:hypothetical protein